MNALIIDRGKLDKTMFVTPDRPQVFYVRVGEREVDVYCLDLCCGLLASQECAAVLLDANTCILFVSAR